MILPVKITQSSVALKVPVTAELIEGGLAVNVIDGALYTMRKNGSVIRIEGDTGNGTIASGASISLGAVMAGVVDVTGTTTITAIVLREGQTRTVRFAGALTLTNSATLVLPGGASIVTAAGDYAAFRGYAGGVTRCMNYTFSPANFVTLAGVQTLTNKTLVSPVINAINGTPIGGATPAAGAFTALSAGAGASNITINGVLYNAATTNSNIGIFADSNVYAGLLAYGSTHVTKSNKIELLAGSGSVIGTVSATGFSVTGNLSATAGFGCNGQTSQTSFPLGANATDLPTAIVLVNKLRAMAINNGIGS